MKKNVILAAAGLALFAWVVAKIGWDEMLGRLAAVWPALPLIVVLSFLRLVAQTSSWAAALRAAGINASTRELIGVRLASQGMGYITPLGAAISEPMKIRLMGGRHAGSAAVATLVDTGTYWFASALFGTLACISAGLLIAHGRRMTIVLTSLACSFVIGIFLIARPKPLLGPLSRALKTRCPGWLTRSVQVETAIRQFASQHPATIRKMFWLDIGCQALLAAEVIAVFWVLGIAFDAGTLMALEVANRGVKMLTGWMPGRIGADEGATAGAFAALGLSSASGLALALIRRMRDLLACAAGFCWLAWEIKKSTPKEAALCRL